MSSRKVPQNIFLPAPQTPRDRTLNQSIVDLYRILARRVNQEVTPTAFSTGSVDIPDGTGAVLTGVLQLTGNEQLTMTGDSQLRIT